MDYHRKIKLHCLLYLDIEDLHLLQFARLVPVHIDSHFAYSLIVSLMSLEFVEDAFHGLMPVFRHLGRMQAHGHHCRLGAHGMESTHGPDGIKIDIRKHHHLHSGLQCAVDRGALPLVRSVWLPFESEFGHIQMRMRIEHISVYGSQPR